MASGRNKGKQPTEGSSRRSEWEEEETLEENLRRGTWQRQAT